MACQPAVHVLQSHNSVQVASGVRVEGLQSRPSKRKGRRTKRNGMCTTMSSEAGTSVTVEKLREPFVEEKQVLEIDIVIMALGRGTYSSTVNPLFNSTLSPSIM